MSAADGGRRAGVALAVLLVAAVAWAEPEQDAAALGESAAARLPAPLVDWSHAMRAYRDAERWVSLAAVDEARPDAAIPVSGMVAVRVTLRQLGTTFGEGDASIEELGSVAADDADLRELVRLATARALAAASQTEQRRRREGGDPKEPDQPGPILTVDLQVAHGVESVLLAADAAPGEVYRQFASGFHGLRMGAPGAGPDVRPLWSWPASNLARSYSAREQLAQLLRRLGADPAADLERVARPGGPTLDRFLVIHLARGSRDEPVEPLVRGGVVLPPHGISRRTLDGMARRLAAHLTQRQRPDGQFAGLFMPTADRLRREVADADDNALAAHALACHAALDPEPEVLASFGRAIGALVPRLLDAKAEPDPAALAWTILSLVSSPLSGADREARDALARRLVAMVGPDGAVLRGSAQKVEPADPTTQAIAASALAALYEQTREPAASTAARSSLDAAWRALGTRPPIAALPWVLDAQWRLGRPAGAQGVDTPGAGPAEVARLVDAVRGCLVRQPPELGPADVVGGFDLAGSPDHGAPQPDWRSTQALLALVAALRDPPRLGVPDPDRCLLDCALGARFVAQLMFDDPGCFYVRDRELVLGGVRRGLDDNELAIAPTATALLAVSDLRRLLASADGPASAQRR